MSETTERAAEWWSDPDREAPGTQWVQVPGVKKVSICVRTGDPAIDLDRSFCRSLLASFTKPIKALSLAVASEQSSAYFTPCATTASIFMGSTLPGAQLKRQRKQPKQSAWKV